MPGFLFSQSELEESKLRSHSQIDSLNENAWLYLHKDIKIFYNLSRQAYLRSNEENYLKGNCLATQSLGTYHYVTNDQDSAKHYYNLALLCRKSLNDSILISGTLNNLANVAEKQGMYPKSIQMFKESLRYLNDTLNIKKARVNSNISAIYIRMGLYETALAYNLDAKRIYEEDLSDSLAYGNCLLNRASIYELVMDYDLALQQSSKSLRVFQDLGSNRHIAKATNNLGNIYLKTGELQKARSAFEQAMEIFTQLNSSSGIASAEQNLAMASKLNGEFIEAIDYLQSSLNRWNKLKNNQKIGEVTTQIGILLLSQAKYLLAKQYLTEALPFIVYNPDLEFDLYSGLARANESLGNFEEAAFNYSKSLQYKDSLNYQQIKWSNLERNYQEKSNKLSLLETENEVFLERQKKDRIFMNALITGFILLSLLFFALLQNKRIRRNKKDTEQQLKIKQKEIEYLLKDQELVSIHNILEIQEDERKRIAQDLHDRLGSMLSMVKVHFNNSNKKLNKIQKDNINAMEKAASLIDEACDEVRKIAHNLSSGVLKNFGLVAAIEDIKKTLINTGEYYVEFVTHNISGRLPKDFEVTGYRIIQELISNIIRHAEASEISVQLLQKNDTLFIEVTDNGKGYDTSLEAQNTGMGFKNIQSRLYPLNGVIKVDSHKGKGTTVFVELPLKNKL